MCMMLNRKTGIQIHSAENLTLLKVLIKLRAEVTYLYHYKGEVYNIVL